MAITNTTRLNIKRWSSDADEYTREHLDDSHRELEQRASVFLTGTATNRPPAGVSNAKGFYLSTDENSPSGILYYSDGVTWHQLNSSQTAVAVTPGNSAAAGSSNLPARSDHVHSFNSFATSTAPISGVSPQSSSAISRGDHIHILGDASVVDKTIAAGAINNSNAFTSGVVGESAILDQNVTRTEIAPSERIPTGTIFAYAGTVAPSGWMMCEGGTVTTSSTLGAMLVAAGSPYNTGGEGAGNVRVPDLRQRVPFGTVSGGAHTVTVYGGANTRTLTTSNMPQHSHNASVTVGTSSPELHSHSVGSLSLGNTDIAHTHSMNGHSHQLGPTQIADASFGYKNGYTSGWAFRVDGTGPYFIRTSPLSGQTMNARNELFEIYDTWTTTTPKNTLGTSDVTNTGSSLTTHNHNAPGFSGQTSSSSPSTHDHSIAGSLSNVGSGTAFDIVPEYASVGYIIKL